VVVVADAIEGMPTVRAKTRAVPVPAAKILRMPTPFLERGVKLIHLVEGSEVLSARPTRLATPVADDIDAPTFSAHP